VDDQVLTFRVAVTMWWYADRQPLGYSHRDSHSGKYAGQSFLRQMKLSPDFSSRGGCQPRAILAVWQRFDANWYFEIAQSGYSK